MARLKSNILKAVICKRIKRSLIMRIDAMLRKLFLFSLVFTAFTAFGAQIIPSGNPVLLDTCGEGALMEISGQKVLILQGTHYEMGYQHGRLMKEQVRALTDKVLSITRGMDMKNLTEAVLSFNSERAQEKMEKFYAGSIEAALERTTPFTPERFFEELRGMAEGSGVPYKDLQLANIFPELFHCSGFALFGAATQEKGLLHGRILDYMTDMGLQDFAVLIVARPDNFNAFVNVGYSGFIGSVTGMNDKHLGFGEMGGRGVGRWDGMPMGYLMRKGLEEAGTLKEAVDLFKETPRTCEYYYVISDAKVPDARGLACWPDKFIEVAPGEAVEQLPHAVEDAVLLSAGDRYEHLVRLVKEQYGMIDLDYALDLMNRPVAMRSCLHRVLMEPGAMKLWVANAAAVGSPNYQACYQPYYEYDFAKLLKLSWPRLDKDKAGRKR